METREITVVSTKNNTTKVISSAATTLAELKADLNANGIDYTNMDFYEAVSKVDLKSDNSILPHDVPYKGSTTNNLVIALTTTNKKIKSGADRKALFAEIRANNLADAIKATFGKNFTQVKTSELEEFVNQNKIKVEEPAPAKKSSCNNKVKDAVIVLTEILYNDGVIGYKEAVNVYKTLGVNNPELAECEASNSPYSSEELDVMLEDIL